MLLDYEKLIKRQQKLNDKMAKLQREKDLKVSTIEKKYESKIEETIRFLDNVNLEIKNNQAYVITHPACDVVKTTTKTIKNTSNK